VCTTTQRPGHHQCVHHHPETGFDYGAAPRIHPGRPLCRVGQAG
jgi:hypothetical protein